MPITASNLTIHVKDMDQSIAFYQSIGLNLTNRWGDHYAQLTAPGLTIGLHPTSGGNLTGNSGNVSIGFTTDDFEATRLMLENLPIAFTDRQEAGGKFLHFNDPDGTEVYFILPKW